MTADVKCSKTKVSPFAGIPVSDFVDIILQKKDRNDEAMYYLLHQRLEHQLRERYDVFHQQLYDDFEDIIEDYFLYLRESGRYPYQSLQRIKNKNAFETWLLNTFRNYLSNRVKVEERMTHSTHSDHEFHPSDDSLSDEQKLTIASQLIAYAHQVFYPRGRFIFLRTLLTILNSQRAISDREMAEALGMTHIAYRVTVHRMKQNVVKFRARLLHGEHLNLDEEHLVMAYAINDDFTNLYPTLFNYYTQCINSLKTGNAVKNLRQQYLDARGMELHEPDIFRTRLTIASFWNKLNRFFDVC